MSGGKGWRILSAFFRQPSQNIGRLKHSSGTVSDSQNFEGYITNISLNFTRKNNPSFKLKEYFNPKCEYCHVIQTQL